MTLVFKFYTIVSVKLYRIFKFINPVSTGLFRSPQNWGGSERSLSYF